MRKVLHIRTRSEDPISEEVLALQRQMPDLELKVVDLTGNQPDYQALLQEIFAADSIECW